MVLAITNKASMNMHSFLKKYHLCAYIKREMEMNWLIVLKLLHVQIPTF